ncbi:MAG: DUF1343 domain-containing protein [Verrucomicrobiota bacterium]
MSNWALRCAVIFFICGITAQATVKLGNEVLVEKNFQPLAGKRVGLIINPSGINASFESTVEVLRHAPDVKLVALFAPEHGIYGDIPAGDKVTNRVDARTGLPVHSLYDKTRKPTQEMLRGLDALVFDVQDTGVRSYTFISTMGLAMQACAEAGVEFVVLDRPNPLGGERVEGPMVEEKFRSFVSQFDIPYVYGMTCGELAQMINGERWMTNQCKLTVVPMHAWKRKMLWRDTGLPWIPTSPHVPEADSPMYMAATGIIGELGSANIGVGYPAPFHCIGLPGMDMWKLSQTLNDYNLPGVKFKPLTYKPYYGPFTTNIISGAQIFILDPRRAPLTPLNFYIIEAVEKVSGHDLFADAKKNFDEAQAAKARSTAEKAAKDKAEGKEPKKEEPSKTPAKPPTAFDMFDKVTGTDATRKALESGKSAAEIVNSWKSGEEKFRREREKYLLYK